MFVAGKYVTTFVSIILLGLVLFIAPASHAQTKQQVWHLLFGSPRAPANRSVPTWRNPAASAKAFLYQSVATSISDGI
jgi:hypothetical protein